MHIAIRTVDRLEILAAAAAGATPDALALQYPYTKACICKLIQEGHASHARKLSEQDEADMLQASKDGVTQAALAAQYGVHRNSVLRALTRAVNRAAAGRAPAPGSAAERRARVLSPEQAADASARMSKGTSIWDLVREYGVAETAIRHALAEHKRMSALRAVITGGSLTPERVQEVVDARAAGKEIPDLAQMFGVSNGVIKQVLIENRKAALAAQPDFSHLA